MAGKLEEAEKLMKKANKLWAPSLLDLRLKPDWEGAAPLYEKAALAFKQAGELDKSRGAYERAAMAQDRLGSGWHAGKLLEAAAAASKDLGDWPKAADFARQAGAAYAQAGRPTAGADAIARVAKQLEDASPSDAAALYDEALDLYEVDGKEGQAGDVFRQAAACLVRGGNYSGAAAVMMRFGQACDKVNARSSQFKAYLGAVVALLYAGDAQEAWRLYQDAMAVDAFSGCDDAFVADALFCAYAEGSADKVKSVVQAKPAFRQLDAAFGRLAMKLPTGDVAAQGRQVSSSSSSPLHAACALLRKPPAHARRSCPDAGWCQQLAGRPLSLQAQVKALLGDGDGGGGGGGANSDDELM